MGNKRKKSKPKLKPKEPLTVRKSIVVPKIWVNGEPYLLLSILDEDWIFMANGVFSKTNSKDPFGNAIEHTSGKGSVKCKPVNTSIFRSDFSFDKLELQEIPIKSLNKEDYLLLGRLGSGDTWKFQAKSLDMSKAKKPKKPDPGGDKFMVVKGSKNVLCSPKKDYSLKNYNFKN